MSEEPMTFERAMKPTCQERAKKGEKPNPF
jgi:hypothetical protein